MKKEQYTLVTDNSELEKAHKNIYFDNEEVTIVFKNNKLPEIEAKLTGRLSIVETLERKISLDHASITHKELRKLFEEIEFEARGKRFRLILRLQGDK